MNGSACVAFSGRGMEEGEAYRSAQAPGWCGQTAARAGSAGRELVLRPTRRDWARLHSVTDVELTGPGLPGPLATDATSALMSFVEQLQDFYRLR